MKRMHPMQRSSACWLALAALPALGQVPTPALIDAAQAQRLIAASPAIAAASRGVEAEQFARQQMALGQQEWTASTSVGRRSSPGTAGTSEWELALERPVRLPGKQALAEQWGAARVAQAQGLQARAWREQARGLLERQGQWLREREATRVWAAQVALFAEQAKAVTQRQALGDAARIERLQADAALAQAQAQWLAAQARRDAARAGLLQQFPGLSLDDAATLPAPAAHEAVGPEWMARLVQAHPEFLQAQREVQAMAAQLAVDRAEQRPDPTLGWRVGRAQGGSERFVGLTVGFSFGGPQREAGTRSTAARLAQAEFWRDEVERRLAADAQARLHELRGAQLSWQQADGAAQQLERSAQALARGHQLGEGSLAEVLAARRLANEQRLAATLAAVDAWLAAWRVELEAGRLWPAP